MARLIGQYSAITIATVGTLVTRNVIIRAFIATATTSATIARALHATIIGAVTAIPA